MGFKVRSKYEDIVAWIQSGGGPGVPYPQNRKALNMMDSHVYAQLTAALSTDATLTVADNLYRRGAGPPGPPGGPEGQAVGGTRAIRATGATEAQTVAGGTQGRTAARGVPRAILAIRAILAPRVT